MSCLYRWPDPVALADALKGDPETSVTAVELRLTGLFDAGSPEDMEQWMAYMGGYDFV